jgi:hypothetical protein
VLTTPSVRLAYFHFVYPQRVERNTAGTVDRTRARSSALIKRLSRRRESHASELDTGGPVSGEVEEPATSPQGVNGAQLPAAPSAASRGDVSDGEGEDFSKPEGVVAPPDVTGGYDGENSDHRDGDDDEKEGEGQKEVTEPEVPAHDAARPAQGRDASNRLSGSGGWTPPTQEMCVCCDKTVYVVTFTINDCLCFFDVFEPNRFLLALHPLACWWCVVP